MATITTDPLYQAQQRAGMDLLGLYNPAQEEARKSQALGSLKQTLAERYARSGLTGGGEELNSLNNAAKNFELGWAERKPDQLGKAIQASNLPISNLLTSQGQESAFNLGSRGQDITKALGELGNQTTSRGQDITKALGELGNQTTSRGQDFSRELGLLSNAISGRNLDINSALGNRKLDMEQAQQDYLKQVAMAGGAGSLLSWLLGSGAGTGTGTGTGNLSNLVNTIGGGLSTIGSGIGSAWNWLTGPGSTPSSAYQDFSNVPQGALDWWNTGNYGEPLDETLPFFQTVTGDWEPNYLSSLFG